MQRQVLKARALENIRTTFLSNFHDMSLKCQIFIFKESASGVNASLDDKKD